MSFYKRNFEKAYKIFQSFGLIKSSMASARIKCCKFKTNKHIFSGLFEHSRKLHRTSSARACSSTGEKPEEKKKKYTDTVNLPRTDFALRLDSQKRIVNDSFIYEKCQFGSLYEWQRENVHGPEFILHDGPPYANGKPHMGHAINKILKDIITRQKLLDGHRIHYIPGWDCHGLPIELKALGGQTNLSPVEIRNKAKDFAEKAIADQREAFSSWGVMADWEKCYFTNNKQYVKNQLQQFYKLYEKGLVYRDLKPVFWSPSSRTALAEAELEYSPTHRSKTVTIRLRLVNVPDAVHSRIPLETAPVYALVWTTTPWTLPVNQAVCFNPDLSYSMVTIGNRSGEFYIVASQLVDSLQQNLGQPVKVISSFPGSCLQVASYVHPLRADQVHQFVSAAHVTTSKGTGLVHTAPAHGPEDFLVALEHSLSIECLVDEDGCYMEGTGSALKGLPVLSEGNEAVLRLLADDIIHSEELVHSYPYDWRTKQPVILRASQQWFIDTDAIKHKAMDALKGVGIFPEHSGSARSGGGLMVQLERRPYWCISRQRVWGVPIPVLYEKLSGQPILSQSLVDRFCNLLDEHGADFWWTLPLDCLVTEELLAEFSLSQDEVEKGEDILDIWFDSGMSWSSVLGNEKVADLYLEGLDQFTGWFQSSLMTSMALRNIAPYRSIFVHGFAVDGEGRKMSKSVGNVVDPVHITHGGKNKKTDPAYGVDTLRWWVASHATQHSNIPVSQSVIAGSAEAVHKIRIVLRFLLGALHDYQDKDCDDLYLLDRYLLHLLFNLHKQVKQDYDCYQFNRVCSTLTSFVTNEVSALYCHTTKDRLYCEPADSVQRRACQFVMNHILETVTRLVAPILPHLAEEVYLHHPSKEGKLLFRSGVNNPKADWDQPEIARVVNLALEVKQTLNKTTAITNTQQLNAKIFTSGETLALLKLMQMEEESSWSQLAEILQVSSVKLVEGNTPLKFHIEAAETTQRVLCPRCRRYTSSAANELCSRCGQVLAH